MVRSDCSAEPSFAARREARRLGIAIAAIMPIIATTIRSSISEKPLSVLCRISLSFPKRDPICSDRSCCGPQRNCQGATAGEQSAMLSKKGQGKCNPALWRKRLAVSCKSLVANRCKPGTGHRDCLAGSSPSAQDASLIDTKLAGTSRGNAAGDYRRGRSHEYGRGSSRRNASGEIETTFHAAGQLGINQLLTAEGQYCGAGTHRSVIAVAGGCIERRLSAADCAQRLFG